jgi:hypothetical protein
LPLDFASVDRLSANAPWLDHVAVRIEIAKHRAVAGEGHLVGIWARQLDLAQTAFDAIHFSQPQVVGVGAGGATFSPGSG